MSKTCAVLVIIGTLLGASAIAQTQAPVEPSAVPVLTGYTGMATTFTPGAQDLGPTFNPILLVPFGDKWLIEAEGEFAADLHHEGGTWERDYEKNLEYLQFDYFANRYMTIVGGRYLIPFGIYAERLHPFWIKNLLTPPLIFGLAPEAGNGGMLRGGFTIASGVNFTYSGYFSAASTNPHMDATRAAGTRVALFFPNARLEIGTSFQRILQDLRSNNVGADFTWQLKPIPLEFRGEYAHTAESGGYWIESAYRLRQIRNSFFRKSQAVFRAEQFFAPPLAMAAGGDGGMAGMEEVPTVNAQRFLGGWNYYINDGLKLSFAYGRQFTPDKNNNVFSVGIAYRFLIPLAGGNNR